MIRALTTDDVERLEPLVAAFFAEGHIDGPFNPKHSANVLRSFIAADQAVAFVAEEGGEFVGVIAGAIHPDMHSGLPIVGEWLWYVDRAHRGTVGLKLLTVFEAEAERRGAHRIVMMHLENSDGEKVADVLQRRQYKPREQVWMKTLCQQRPAL